MRLYPVRTVNVKCGTALHVSRCHVIPIRDGYGRTGGNTDRRIGKIVIAAVEARRAVYFPCRRGGTVVIRKSVSVGR